MTIQKIHVFELAGLGQAPFKCVGMYAIPSAGLAEKNPDAYNAALREMPTGYRCGTCNYCGHPIMNNYLINSADGKKFAVGCECVFKTGDTGLTTEAREIAKKIAREKRFQTMLARHEARQKAEEEKERQENGGFTLAELREIERKRQEEADREKAKILKPLADLLNDNQGGFRQSVALDMAKGQLPRGKGENIVLDILAKMAGRKGSRLYNAELERIEGIFDQVRAM